MKQNSECMWVISASNKGQLGKKGAFINISDSSISPFSSFFMWATDPIIEIKSHEDGQFLTTSNQPLKVTLLLSWWLRVINAKAIPISTFEFICAPPFLKFQRLKQSFLWMRIDFWCFSVWWYLYCGLMIWLFCRCVASAATSTKLSVSSSAIKLMDSSMPFWSWTTMALNSSNALLCSSLITLVWKLQNMDENAQRFFKHFRVYDRLIMHQR